MTSIAPTNFRFGQYLAVLVSIAPATAWAHGPGVEAFLIAAGIAALYGAVVGLFCASFAARRIVGLLWIGAPAVVLAFVMAFTANAESVVEFLGFVFQGIVLSAILFALPAAVAFLALFKLLSRSRKSETTANE